MTTRKPASNEAGFLIPYLQERLQSRCKACFRGSIPSYWSMNDLSFFDRTGCLSLRRALASI